MGFTKLDEGILQSSIVAEDSDTFKIWILLLAACKENGVAYISPVFLSSICRMDLDLVLRALQKLQDPDPFSRSLDQDGRRVRRVDGGFEIINYQVYRTRSLKSAEAERKRLYRNKEKEEGEIREEEAEAEASGQSRTMSHPVRTNQDDVDKRRQVNKIMEAWNAFAKKEGLPTIMAIPVGSARERHLLARIKDGFDMEKALEAIHYQGFLKGENKDGWVVNFDWILSPSNYLKLVEGNYTKVRRGDRTGHAENFNKD